MPPPPMIYRPTLKGHPHLPLSEASSSKFPSMLGVVHHNRERSRPPLKLATTPPFSPLPPARSCAIDATLSATLLQEIAAVRSTPGPDPCLSSLSAGLFSPGTLICNGNAAQSMAKQKQNKSEGGMGCHTSTVEREERRGLLSVQT